MLLLKRLPVVAAVACIAVLGCADDEGDLPIIVPDGRDGSMVDRNVMRSDGLLGGTLDGAPPSDSASMDTLASDSMAGTGGSAGQGGNGGMGGNSMAGMGGTSATACDLIDQDCANNQACYPKVGGGTECLPRGQLGEGAECIEHSQCGLTTIQMQDFQLMCGQGQGVTPLCLPVCQPGVAPCLQNRPCVPITDHAPIGFCDQ